MTDFRNSPKRTPAPQDSCRSARWHLPGGCRELPGTAAKQPRQGQLLTGNQLLSPFSPREESSLPPELAEAHKHLPQLSQTSDPARFFWGHLSPAIETAGAEPRRPAGPAYEVRSGRRIPPPTSLPASPHPQRQL
ncbi:hypothetical protein VULLAG_LOCUS4132 [Vulpes lagopus]